MTTAIEVRLPGELLSQAQEFIRGGWVGDLDALLTESLRRYLDSHGPALDEAFLREDVAWGLHGAD